MPRRRELADVADGMTGHIMASYVQPEPPSSSVARAARATGAAAFRIDLLTGSVDPHSRHLAPLAQRLRSDLERHVRARSLLPAWVVSAWLDVDVAEPVPGQQTRLRCRVSITDDRGATHTSTRAGLVWIPARGLRGLLGLSGRRAPSPPKAAAPPWFRGS